MRASLLVQENFAPYGVSTPRARPAHEQPIRIPNIVTLTLLIDDQKKPNQDPFLSRNGRFPCNFEDSTPSLALIFVYCCVVDLESFFRALKRAGWTSPGSSRGGNGCVPPLCARFGYFALSSAFPRASNVSLRYTIDLPTAQVKD